MGPVCIKQPCDSYLPMTNVAEDVKLHLLKMMRCRGWLNIVGLIIWLIISRLVLLSTYEVSF